MRETMKLGWPLNQLKDGITPELLPVLVSVMDGVDCPDHPGQAGNVAFERGPDDSDIVIADGCCEKWERLLLDKIREADPEIRLPQTIKIGKGNELSAMMRAMQALASFECPTHGPRTEPTSAYRMVQDPDGEPAFEVTGCCEEYVRLAKERLQAALNNLE